MEHLVTSEAESKAGYKISRITFCPIILKKMFQERHQNKKNVIKVILYNILPRTTEYFFAKMDFEHLQKVAFWHLNKEQKVFPTKFLMFLPSFNGSLSYIHTCTPGVPNVTQSHFHSTQVLN